MTYQTKLAAMIAACVDEMMPIYRRNHRGGHFACMTLYYKRSTATAFGSLMFAYEDVPPTRDWIPVERLPITRPYDQVSVWVRDRIGNLPLLPSGTPTPSAAAIRCPGEDAADRWAEHAFQEGCEGY